MLPGFLSPLGPGLLLVALGDSKTGYTYQSRLTALLDLYQPVGSTPSGWAGGYLPGTLHGGGWTAGNLAAAVDAWLAGLSASPQPNFALINIGANDMFFGTALPTFEADLAYTLDAVHAYWPTTRLLVAKPWRRPFDPAALHASIDTVLATRAPWAAVGIIESGAAGVLEFIDDGDTFTDDGIHPNVPWGVDRTAARWQTVMGQQ